MLAAVRADSDRADSAADAPGAVPMPAGPDTVPLDGPRELNATAPPAPASAEPGPRAPLPQRTRGSSGLVPGKPNRPVSGRTADAPDPDAITESLSAILDAAEPEPPEPDPAAGPEVRTPVPPAASDPQPEPAAAPSQQPPARQAPPEPVPPEHVSLRPAPLKPARRPARAPTAKPARKPGHPAGAGLPRGPGRPRVGRRARITAAAAAVLAIVAIGSLIHVLLVRSQTPVALSGSSGEHHAVTRDQAAAWLAAQMSRATSMSCDHVMCAVLRAHKVPAADLDVLRPGGDPVLPLAPGGSARPAVIVATAAVRGQLGSRLSSVYAPVVIARFGSGPDRIEVRAIATQGAPAFRAMARTDLLQRRESGAELLQTDRIVVTADSARGELARGQVDARLLVIITGLAAQQPLEIMAFGDRSPGAGLDQSPLRSAELAPAPGSPRRLGAAFARSVRAFLLAQSGPFAVARAGPARLPDGQVGVRFQVTAPSPLGLLGATP
jgi:hypothetical protein